MSRVYTVTFEKISISAAQDLFAILNATTKVTRIHDILLAASGVTASAMQTVKVLRRAAMALGSGGNVATPAPMEFGDAAYAGTCHINDTTPATGTATTIREDAFNVLSGWYWLPVPEDRPVLAPAAGLVVQFVDTPGTVLYSGTITLEEIG